MSTSLPILLMFATIVRAVMISGTLTCLALSCRAFVRCALIRCTLTCRALIYRYTFLSRKGTQLRHGHMGYIICRDIHSRIHKRTPG